MNACCEAKQRAGPQATYNRLGRGSGPTAVSFGFLEKREKLDRSDRQCSFPRRCGEPARVAARSGPPPGVTLGVRTAAGRPPPRFGMKPYEWPARPDGRAAPPSSTVPGGRDVRIDTQQVNTIHDRKLGVYLGCTNGAVSCYLGDLSGKSPVLDRRAAGRVPRASRRRGEAASGGECRRGRRRPHGAPSGTGMR